MRLEENSHHFMKKWHIEICSWWISSFSVLMIQLQFFSTILLSLELRCFHRGSLLFQFKSPIYRGKFLLLFSFLLPQFQFFHQFSCTLQAPMVLRGPLWFYFKSPIYGPNLLLFRLLCINFRFSHHYSCFLQAPMVSPRFPVVWPSKEKISSEVCSSIWIES